MKGQAYLGAIGRTRTAIMHLTDPRGALVAVPVYTSIDATADPGFVAHVLENLRAARTIEADQRRIEFAPTADLFNAPQDHRTEAYITGRFG